MIKYPLPLVIYIPLLVVVVVVVVVVVGYVVVCVAVKKTATFFLTTHDSIRWVKPSPKVS